jgi:hypothetical protein
MSYFNFVLVVCAISLCLAEIVVLYNVLLKNNLKISFGLIYHAVAFIGINIYLFDSIIKYVL